MRTYSIIVLSVVACCLWSATVDRQVKADGSNLARFPEFDKYMSMYNKHYANLAEQLNRMRLFMSRAMSVFVKGVQYNNGEASYYLAFNDKSDWTQQERANLYQQDDNSSPPLVSSESPVYVQDSDTISNEELKKIIAEIGGQPKEVTRKRRSVPDVKLRRNLTIDQLMRDPRKVSSDVSPKFVASVPANNPDYVEPEMMSEGADDDDSNEEPPLSEKEKKDLPDDNFVSNVIKSFDKLWAGKQPLASSSGSASKKTPEVSVDDKVFLDYRDSNCLAPVKDQRKCGSCYAFATTAVYEYLHCKQTGKLVTFSEQYVVDCGRKFEMNQCAGGKINKVAEFVNAAGLELSTYYPYRARNSGCPYDASDKLAQMGHTRVRDGRMIVMYLSLLYEDQVVRLLKSQGPMTFSIRTSDEFQDYGGGVHRLRDPSPSSSHAMTLVGHGIEDGEEYWLIRNSYGTSWGEQGYYKLSKDHSDPKALLWIGTIEAHFDENKQHAQDKVRERVLKNRNLIEKMFNL